LELSLKDQINERFSRAVDQLGNSQLDVRIGGIYALEQIARDAPGLHWPIMEMLSACVRVHTKASAVSRPAGEEPPVDESVLANPVVAGDMQAVVTVLGRRSSDRDLDVLDLTGVNLEGVRLAEARLQNAFLQRANLQNANLIRANLQGADLSWTDLRAFLAEANLQNANLIQANLREASLRSANLEKAHLEGADLQGATLLGANLQGAILLGANLWGAQLTGANLHEAILQREGWPSVKGLTVEQLKEAEGVNQAHLPDYLQEPS
jgi:hypothetical protein